MKSRKSSATKNTFLGHWNKRAQNPSAESASVRRTDVCMYNQRRCVEMRRYVS